MHRFRSWTLDPPEWRTQRNRALSIEGGDGSTLNLDFMQGALDPSINFSRSTNATVINSSGYVENARANMIVNSTMSGGTTVPTIGLGPNSEQWGSSIVSGTSQKTNVILDGCEQWEQIATNQRPYLTYNTYLSIQPGIEYVFSVYLDELTTGSLFTSASNFIFLNPYAGTVISSITYISPSGVEDANGTQPLVTGRWQVRFKCGSVGASGVGCRFGIGLINNATGSCRISRPQLELNSTARAYIPNSSLSSGKHLPRFDYEYEPTKIGTLRGLLIEPQVANLAAFSEVCFGNNWSSSLGATTDTVTTVANPEGIFSTSRNYATAGGSYHNTGIAYTPTVSNQVVTASCWFKANGYTKAYIADGANGYYLGLFDLVTGVATVGSTSGTATTNKVSCKMEPYPNGWWRCQVTATLPSTINISSNYGSYPNTGATITNYGVTYSGTGNVNDGVYVYGYQLEVSPCATSLIKTGSTAGGATRTPDVARITDISSWFTSDRELTTVVDFIPYPRPASEFPSPLSFKDTGGAFHGYETYLQFPATSNGYSLTIATKITASSNTESNATTTQRNFQRYRLGFAVSSTSHLRSVNGVTCTTITPPNALPATGLIDVCGIGQSGLNSSYLGGWIRQIKYWPSFKAQADLNTITSLEQSTPTLDFDFRSGVMPSGFSVIRSSASTYTDSDGLVKFARSNLIKYSTDISVEGGGSIWFRNATPTLTDVTSTISPPISGIPGKVIRLTSVNTNSFVDNVNITTNLGYTYTASVYVKKAGSLSTIQLLLGTSSAWSGGNPFVVFNFDTPASSTVSGGVSAWGYIDAGNGWYRVWLQGRCILATSTSLRIYAHNGTTFADAYVWGAQLEIAYAVTPLIYTTTTAYYAPRFEHTTTGAVRGLLLEGQAVNLARYSETLETTGNFWGYNAATRTVESSDVNPTGGIGSISFGPTTNGGSRYCGLFLTGQTTTTTYTFSAWIKAKGTSAAVISIQNSAGAVNSTITMVSQPSGANASISGQGTGFPKLTNLSTTGWTKIAITTNAALGGTGVLNVFVYPNDTITQTTSDTLFMWGAQLEEGNGYSSYIPTGASQVTRIGDGYELTSIASANYNTKAGTLLNSFIFNKHATSFNSIVGFSMATDAATFETFANITSGLFAAVRGDNLATGGSNEVSRPYSLYVTTKQAANFNTENDPIVAENVNNSFNGINRQITSSGNTKIPTRFILNRASALTATNNHPSVILESVKYWPISYSNIELTTLATG